MGSRACIAEGLGCHCYKQSCHWLLRLVPVAILAQRALCITPDAPTQGMVGTTHAPMALLLICESSRRLLLLLQVAVILAKMELVGVGIDPRHLLGHKAALKQRMAAISTRAQQLAGGPFNLASSSQLAKVLYSDLGLPAPTGTGRRRNKECEKQPRTAAGTSCDGILIVTV